MRYRVTCTTKHEKHERITHLGCINESNASHHFSEQEAITRIENYGETFYVERPAGHVIDVEVAIREGERYLKTKPDGEKLDNLLSLPDCPAKKPVPSPPIRTVAAAGSHSVPFAPYWGV